jgi:hypothetical protein
VNDSRCLRSITANWPVAQPQHQESSTSGTVRSAEYRHRTACDSACPVAAARAGAAKPRLFALDAICRDADSTPCSRDDHRLAILQSMAATSSKVLSEAMKLPADERVRVAEKLLQSADAEGFEEDSDAAD